MNITGQAACSSMTAAILLLLVFLCVRKVICFFIRFFLLCGEQSDLKKVNTPHLILKSKNVHSDGAVSISGVFFPITIFRGPALGIACTFLKNCDSALRSRNCGRRVFLCAAAAPCSADLFKLS